MKSTFLTALQAIGIGLLLAASLVCGQMDHKFTMQIPFDFAASNQQFLAGDYTIKSDVSTGTVVIRREDGPEFVIATYSGGENKDYAHAKLVFHQYGTHFFLSQVWPAGATGRELSKSRKEVEMAKSSPQPEVVSVLASIPRLRKTNR